MRYATLLLAGLTLTAQAEMLTWVDANARQHFGSQPPSNDQPVDVYNLSHGYVGDTSSAKAPEASSQPGATAQSKQDMCRTAATNLKAGFNEMRALARAQLRSGALSQDDHVKAMDNLNQAAQAPIYKECLAAQGPDLQRYECMANGNGVMWCSGISDELLSVLR